MFPLYTATALAQPNLVLISLDTVRADALSCYGDPPTGFTDHARGTPRTPVLDGLAAEGLRFERFFAESPSTLASHATMFTGRGPHQTLVVRNGYPLDPELPTLAERLRDAGYATRAVIGAAALERGTGIDRGFQVYDDNSPTLRGLMYQSPADEVVQRALKLAAERPEQPLFLFAHFFDAHAPYEPPEPYRARFLPLGYQGPWADPERKLRPLIGTTPGPDHHAVDGRYLGEVAWLDHQIGALLNGLQGLGVLDHALVVVVGDHGEALSDDPHYSWTHGNDVSDAVMHVPLIVTSYGVPMRSGVASRTAAMHSLAPSIEHLLGLKPTLGVPLPEVLPGPIDSTDGWPHRPTTPVFMEATRPRSQQSNTHWNNLPLARRVVAGSWEHRAYPEMNEASTEPLSPVLSTLLTTWDELAPPHQKADMPDHTVRALKALGYLSD